MESASSVHLITDFTFKAVFSGSDKLKKGTYLSVGKEMAIGSRGMTEQGPLKIFCPIKAMGTLAEMIRLFQILGN